MTSAPLEIIERRVATLANHHQKYLVTIRRFIDSLVDALEESGKLTGTHLWRSSSDPADEMSVIAGLTSDPERNVQHVSCYYALQFLHMNFRHQDILALGVTSRRNLIEVYQQFMMNIGVDFRTLTTAYLDTLIDIHLPGAGREDFFICSVGTRADQDDIDVGIITSEKIDDSALNLALKNVTQNMLVYATPLHLYLSEHVGRQIYSTTIPEYHELLTRQIQDVVIISELLGARRILGSEDLFARFHDEIITRYYHDPAHDIRYHEGFLRGIMGETRALLVTPLDAETISPKEDALRIIKSILAARKTIHGLPEVNAWDIIGALLEREPHLQTEYDLLHKALTFLELFKFQLQHFIVQEDSFRPAEIDQEQLTLLASKMGYEPIGTVSAWDQCVIDYYRYVKEARRVCDNLLLDISGHLREVSLFTRLLRRVSPASAPSQYTGNIAVDFIRSARFFLGTRYWDDILELLDADTDLLDAFIDGFHAFGELDQEDVIAEYMEWAEHSPLTIMRLITILGRRLENELGETVTDRMSRAFLIEIETLPYITERLCRIFSRYPGYLHAFLQYLPTELFPYLYRILEHPVIDDRYESYRIRFRKLCEIHEWSGQYFHRFFSRVIANHPEYLDSLTSSQQLNEMATGQLALVDVYPTPAEKKAALGDYYDLEFVRIGIGTMHGTDLRVTNREFTAFCDNYIEKLYDVCTEEVEKESTGSVPDTDSFAFIVAGGHAREQAYDDDWDLIAIVDTDDEVVIAHATRVVTRMNREILRRGLLPHYRLGEILGGFVTPLNQLEEYLSAGDEDSFIDLSQLLGARLLVGSGGMKTHLNERILDRFIFDRRAEYIARMIGEIRSRQAAMGTCDPATCNLKETQGGLRDIEAVALILKAWLRIHAPISQDFFPEIREQVPDLTADLDILHRSRYYLRTIRDLYRLTVAAEDNINPDYLDRVATIFRESNRPEWSEAGLIMDQVRTILADSAGAIERVITWFETALD